MIIFPLNSSYKVKWTLNYFWIFLLYLNILSHQNYYFIKNLIKYLFFYIQKHLSSSNTFILESILYREQSKFSFYFHLRSKIIEKFASSLKETISNSLFQFKYHTPIKKGQQSHETFSSPLRWTKFKVRKILSLSFSARSHCNEKSYRGYRSGGPPRLFFINRWNELWESVACFVIISRGLGTSFN